jgi:hypothetical protein
MCICPRRNVVELLCDAPGTDHTVADLDLVGRGGEIGGREPCGISCPGTAIARSPQEGSRALGQQPMARSPTAKACCVSACAHHMCAHPRGVWSAFNPAAAAAPRGWMGVSGAE